MGTPSKIEYPTQEDTQTRPQNRHRSQQLSSKTAVRTTAHAINLEQLDKDALDVIHQLNAHGYTALLVGGCIRDVLCGLTPKDFDVATDAPLDEIKRIFDAHE